MRNDLNLYHELNVWRRKSEGELVRYRCFRVFPGGGYCVQSADFYNTRHEMHDRELGEQFLELMSEESPAVRSGSLYATLEEAIAAHDSDFAE